MSAYKISDIVVDDIILENITIRRVIVENVWSIERDIPTFHNDIICDITLSKDTIHTATKLVRSRVISSSTNTTYSDNTPSKIECYNPTFTKKLDGNILVNYTHIVGGRLISKAIPISKLPNPHNMRLRGKFILTILVITQRKDSNEDIIGFVIRDVDAIANSLVIQSQVWI